MSEITIGDLLKAFEKLRVNRVEGEVRLLVSEAEIARWAEKGFWESPSVPEQAEYQCGMVDRKADNLPLNLWDEVE